MSHLKKTTLNDAHRKLGGRMIDFGGWDMPIQYPAGTIEEHLAVRTAVGIFDVSHMGEIEIRGPQALALRPTRDHQRRSKIRRRTGPILRADLPRRHIR